MNSAHRPIDTKREEFRKYLERTGVLDAITKTLAHLYEEPDKPNDALSAIYKFMGESFPDKIQPAGNFEKELAEEREKVKQLTLELDGLKTKIAAMEKAEAEAEKDEEAMLEDPFEPPAPTDPVPPVVAAAAAPVVPPQSASPAPVVAPAQPASPVSAPVSVTPAAAPELLEGLPTEAPPDVTVGTGSA